MNSNRFNNEVQIMKESTFTFRIPEELKKGFETIAKEQDQSTAQILRAFMRDYVHTHSQRNLDFKKSGKK